MGMPMRVARGGRRLWQDGGMAEPAVPTHVIAHLSDNHFLADGGLLYGMVDTDAPLAVALAQLERSQIALDALVFTGDITDLGQPDAYRRVRALVEPVAERLGARLVWVMGNHDARSRMRSELMDEIPSSGDARSEEPLDRVYDLNGLRLVVLDTSVPGFHHGELTDAQRAWLGDVLAVPAPHGTLVALHHPPIPTSLPLMPILELQDQHLLAEVLHGTDVRGILGGHLHYTTTSLFAGIPISVAAATCYTMDLSAGANQLTGVDGGRSFNLVHVYEDQVVHSVVPVGEYPVVNSFPLELVQRIEGMSAEQRREAFSRHARPEG